MVDLLNAIFYSFWTFIGTFLLIVFMCLLITSISHGVARIIFAIRGKQLP